MRNMGKLFIAALAIGIVGALSGPTASLSPTGRPSPQKAAYDAQVKIAGASLTKASNCILSISIEELRNKANFIFQRAVARGWDADKAMKAQDWPTASGQLMAAKESADMAFEVAAAAKKVEPYVVGLRDSLAKKRQRVDAVLACWKGKQAQLDMAEKSLQAAVKTMGAADAADVSQTFAAQEAIDGLLMNCN